MSAAVSTTSVMNAEIVKDDALAPALVGLESSTARQLREAFIPALVQIEEWERQARDLTVTDETQTAKMEMAGVMRKALKKVRVGIEKKRKEMNADALARTKAINAAAGIIEALIVPLEKRLQEQETFAERAQAVRRDALRDARAETLRAYGTDPAIYTSLGDMSEETWSSTVETARLAHQAKIEAARQAELVRIEVERVAAERREADRQEAVRKEAERVERERVQAEENARLKQEAADREAAAKVERERVEAERAAERAKAKADADARDAEACASREAAEAETRKAREEADRAAAALEAERQAARDREEADAHRVAAERAAAEQVERDRLAAEEAARVAAELAPDREKLAAFAGTLRALAIPNLTTARGQAAANKVADQLAKMVAWVEKTGATL